MPVEHNDVYPGGNPDGMPTESCRHPADIRVIGVDDPTVGGDRSVLIIRGPLECGYDIAARIRIHLPACQIVVMDGSVYPLGGLIEKKAPSIENVIRSFARIPAAIKNTDRPRAAQWKRETRPGKWRS